MNYDLSKYDLEPFELERAKRGDAVCMANGESVEITNWDLFNDGGRFIAAKGPKAWTWSGFPYGGLNVYELKHPVLKRVPDADPALPTQTEVGNKINARFVRAMANESDHARIKAFAVVLDVARLVNDGWDPDWENGEEKKWSFQHDKDKGVFPDWQYHYNYGAIMFKSEEAIELAMKILNSWEPNDAILLRALGVK